MKKTILEFIIESIISNQDDKMLGEEIRVLLETIQKIINNGEESILEVIYNLIIDNPTDNELGRKIRHLAPLILIGIYVE